MSARFLALQSVRVNLKKRSQITLFWNARPVPQHDPAVPRELDVEPRVSPEARRARIDEINARILEIVNDSGAAFISHTVLKDGYAIRVSIGNLHTGTGDVDRLWEHLNDAAQKAKAELSTPLLS